MKHLKHLFTALLLLCSTAVAAHDFSVSGIYYSISSSTNKTVEVTYRGTSYSEYSNEYTGSEVIPESVNYDGITYRVTSIGDYAFRGCTGLTSITIPNSVTSIGYGAFYNCPGLKTVINFSDLIFSEGSNYNGNVAYFADKVYNVPNGSIEGDYIFGKPSGENTLVGYLGNATELTLPDDYKGESYDIGANVFKDNTNITSVVIPNSVTSIGDDAFRGCTGLTSITIPNSVDYIGYEAFYNCSGLTSVVIGNSVRIIGNEAFYNCSGLTSVVIGNSVRIIGKNAFRGCIRLGTVENLSNLPLSKGSEDYGYVAYYADRVINSTDISGISLDRGAVTLVEGESLTLKAIVKFVLGSVGDMPDAWSTSNRRVATVKNGVVTAVAAGTATITALAGVYSATCVVTVEESNKIASLEQLKNNALYYISQPHHTKGATSWAVDKGGEALKSNVDLGVERLSSDTRQQFAILSVDGGATRYLYHVGEKKFINKDGSLGENPVNAVNIKAGAFDNTFMFYFDDAHYINVGGIRQMTIDDWSILDGGNSCTIESVGEFDPEVALGIITGIEDVEDVDGEIVVYNLQGNRILDVDNLERGIYIVNGKKVFVK